ncbi:UDP-N-acetylenolpyruvoylglucosamine reductase-like isoform X1 [Gossypium australe]|uniref:UDP-N-acetylmuramate dehydrogenase n=1 Tax=Gossypium australe TaxID=47621 RepID=A0A5B6UYL8_9ROSI|nr:UDP-N-acetylenolpyruvoylglucosamine reductase-like isoform X1 [Gossypium australe]
MEINFPFSTSRQNPSLMLPTPPTFTKMASMAFPVVQSPRNSTSIFSSNKDQTQNWNALKFVRGKKLLKDLSTWGIGGPCNYFVQVFHQTHLLSAIRYCRVFSIPYVVIGKGSNCLFDDLGFDGCVILNQIDFLERMEPGVYRAGSGFRFNHLGSLSCNEGFTGLEFAAGIPGTVGGATYMNAGANGQETANVIESIDIVTTEGNFRTLNRIDLTFGYRSSSFQDMDNLAAIVAATFRLERSGSAKKRQQELLKRRRATQPVNERSAGSVFRNPVNLGVSAAELIDKAGLKGCSIGGAMVSNIHANFLVNTGASTSQDMLNLIALVKDKVHSKFGVELEEEVLYFHPYWNYANLER